MKTLVVLLIAGSLALNLVLFGVLIAGRSAAPVVAPAPTAIPAAAPAPAPAVDAQTWTSLRADDLAAMVQQLREGGFPPEVVRAIMAAHLRETYAARIKALDPQAENRPFWKAYSIDPRVRAAQSQLYREQQKILRELLGADADPQESVNALYQGRRLDSVPAEKIDDVRRLLREFNDARSELFSSFGGGMIGPDMQKRIAALEKDHQEALTTVLSPRELEDYNLRNSDTARQLRSTLTAFNPTEEEFRALYKLQADFDQRFGRMYSIPGAEEQQRRNEAQKQLNEQIKATLGPVRGADYERATDYSFRQTSQLVARLELPPETTSRVWEIQKEVQGRIGEVQRSNPSQPEREARLAELAAEAQARVTALIGARGFEAYKQYGGSWMQMLRPRPAPSTPPVPRN